MQCVRCGHTMLNLGEPCPNCHFTADPEQIQELSHVRWILDQANDLNRLTPRTREILKDYYGQWQRELETRMGLRLARFSPDEAHMAWPTLARLEFLQGKVDEWARHSLITPAAAQTVGDDIAQEIATLKQRLEGYPAPDKIRTNAERLLLIVYAQKAVDALAKQKAFVSDAAEAEVRGALEAEKAELEISLGRRPAPSAPKQPAEPQPVVAQETPAQAQPEKGPATAQAAPETSPLDPAPATPPPTSPRPASPFGDRLWRTLLSERTLQAMLFLGIFLLFSAALSFVFWGWQSFSAPLRVAIPTAFTLLFFGIAWYVRTQTRMYRSGIALTAIAALLIPVDFYTVYANFDIPADATPLFWLATSLLCLIAYLAVTWLTASGFFGYLVAAAAGSATLAFIELGNQFLAVSLDWRTAALSMLCGLLLLIAAWLRDEHRAPARWRSMAEPFRNIALIAVGTLMLLSLGFRYIDRRTFDTLHTAMTINWWIGGFLFGWGAIYYRSRTLGILAALSLPIATYMAQAAMFDTQHINLAWHSVGFATLVPLYFLVGHILRRRKDDPVLYGHGRTATGWAIALTVVAALWSLTDLKSAAAAATSHTILIGGMVLAALLWQRPRVLLFASLFSFTAITFAMNELNLAFASLAIGWASLSILHILIALRVGGMQHDARARFAAVLVLAGFIIAAAALVPPLAPYKSSTLSYVLLNWVVLAAWSARLAHIRQPGFVSARFRGVPVYQWLAAVPLPLEIVILLDTGKPADWKLALLLAGLAWAMLLLSYRLARVSEAYRWPWYSVASALSVIAPFIAFVVDLSGYAPGICVLSTGLLYLVDAVVNRERRELLPSGLAMALGVLLLVIRADTVIEPTMRNANISLLAMAGMVGLYILAGLWLERSGRLIRRFLQPLYLTAHIVAALTLLYMYAQPLAGLLGRFDWSDEMRFWGGVAQLVLGVTYAAYTWGTFRERWAHAAAWLVVGGAGFITLIWSSGSGRLAAEAAVGAVAFILLERALFWLRRPQSVNGIQIVTSQHQRAFVRLAWRLYHRALLLAGWTLSVAVIGIALIRNLILLGGGRTPQIWATVAIALIVGLYALSARLYRQARFTWFVAWLVILPWTIMTHLGWLVTTTPALREYAISWMVLAWVLYLLHLLIQRFAPFTYAQATLTVAHCLVPFSLLWGAADSGTSRITFALAIALYAFAAIREHRRLVRGSAPASVPAWNVKFLYLALGLVPIWCVYLLNGILPAAQNAHHGLMLLSFGILGLVAGRLPVRAIPAQLTDLDGPTWEHTYSLPAHLTGYVAVIFGTLLVADDPALLALVLVYDALLMILSARLFRNPLWTFGAATSGAFAFWLTLTQSSVPFERQGWWMLGLAALYLVLAWALQRARLTAYSTAPMMLGFVLTALSLPLSSQDQVGAFWGYGGAAILYGISAFWLTQPALLIPACALVLVPYAVGLRLSNILPEYYGLSLLPGAVAALAAGWWLEQRFGVWRNFPWGQPQRWLVEFADRALNWWALSPYALGLGLAIAAPLFTHGKPGPAALNWLLAMALFGWAVYRFRLRVWLLAFAVAGHLAAILYLQDLGWWRQPSEAALRFLPVTILTAALALTISRRRRERSPLQNGSGWSVPLFLLLLGDLVLIQEMASVTTTAGAMVSLVHALLIAVIASFYNWRALTFASAALGMLAMIQWLLSTQTPLNGLPVPMAGLTLTYGAVGHVLFHLGKRRMFPQWITLWVKPLMQFSHWFSLVVLTLAAVWGMNLVNWTVRALVGLPFRDQVYLPDVQMVVGVLALIGLLYVAAAFTYNRFRLTYIAVGMLLTAWMLFAFYVQEWGARAHIQWYAVPAGLYLLGMGYLECRRGNRNLGRWLDYAAVVLMMGSLFWQTLMFGFAYALLLGAEGFAAFWWGSARRLRRFLYAGMMGVVLATVAQLVNSLQSINQWIVFGLIGLLVVLAAVLVERKLDDIKAWRQVLDTWE